VWDSGNRTMMKLKEKMTLVYCIDWAERLWRRLRLGMLTAPTRTDDEMEARPINVHGTWTVDD